MESRLAAAGALLLILGGMLCFIYYDFETRGESRLLATFQGPTLTHTAEAAIERGERLPQVLVWFGYERVPMAAYSESKTNCMALAQGLVTAYGGRVIKVLPLLQVAVMRAPAENLKLMAALPPVRAIDYDQVLKVLQYMTTGEVKTELDFEGLYGRGWLGQEVDIYYLDSGCAPGVASARTVGGGPPTDQFGHGCAVGTLLMELAPESRVHSIKVLDQFGMGRISTILEGLELALRSEPDPEIISASIGSSPTIFDSLARGFEVAVRDFNICAVAAAGNDPSFVSSPARSKLVIGVGALTADGWRTTYSAEGDLWAPGDQRVNWGGTPKGMRGTSFATPVVSAMLADYYSGYPEATMDELKTLEKGSIETREHLAMPVGTKLAETYPVPETPLAVKLWPLLVVMAAGVGMMVLALVFRRGR